MKRLLCILMTAVLLLPLAGCIPQKNEIQNPVTFYYRKSDPAYGDDDSIIASELRDAGSSTGDAAAVIARYLQGPESPELSRTFPQGVTLVSLRTEDGVAHIVLDDSFSALTGINLTVACACLTMTVCELTGAASARIRTETTLLDENRVITMEPENLLLMDESDIVIDPG